MEQSSNYSVLGLTIQKHGQQHWWRWLTHSLTCVPRSAPTMVTWIGVAAPGSTGVTWVTCTSRQEVSEDDRHHIQTAVHYHVGNRLRERLSDEDLLRADMLPSSPKERLNTQRTMGNILLAQRTGAQPLWRMHPDTNRAWLLSVKALTVALEQVEVLDHTKLSASARLSVAEHLANLSERLVCVVERLE